MFKFLAGVFVGSFAAAYFLTQDEEEQSQVYDEYTI
jgi:hypothetical protein